MLSESSRADREETQKSFWKDLESDLCFEGEQSRLSAFRFYFFCSDAIFCMEDGPAKPSSVGIEKVLKTLQISPNQVFVVLVRFFFVVVNFF